MQFNEHDDTRAIAWARAYAWLGLLVEPTWGLSCIWICRHKTYVGFSGCVRSLEVVVVCSTGM